MKSLPFSVRIAQHFGALFLIALGSLALLWYFGLPWLGLNGAGHQRLMEATRLLELSAGQQRDAIQTALDERRGDVLLVSENKVLAQQLQGGDLGIQQTVERDFDGLQRAYPDVYQGMQVVDPRTGKVRASSVAAEVGKAFPDAQLLARAAQAGMVERVEQVAFADGPRLFVVRQILALDADGYSGGVLLGILLVQLDLAHLVDDGVRAGRDGFGRLGTSLLFDVTGQLLARFPVSLTGEDVFRREQRVANGFEGTLTLPDESGQDLLVVYRHLLLSGSHGWTLVHFQSRDDALGALKGSAHILIVVGLLLTLVALLFIGFAARRLTRPLKHLAQTTRKFDAGHLSVRARTEPGDGRELVELAEAFNGMAAGIEAAHQMLEARVLERTQALASERDTAQRYLDIAGVMLMALDIQGRITLINRKGAEVLGEPESLLLGRDWFGDFLPAEDGAAVRNVFKALMDGDAPAPDYYENRIVNAKGQLLDMAWHNTMLRDAQGVPTGTLSSAEDITGRKQAQADLEAANRELARSNAELEQFAYVASHDLQEPLRSVSSCVQLLKKRYGGTLDARADEFIAHAVGGSQRMQALIDDLLAYSRVSAAPCVFAPTDTATALARACANLAKAIEESQARVTHGNLPTVNADAGQLTQLFQNLVGNAIKFRGDKPALVHVDASQEAEVWRFTVTDHGIGIEPAYFTRIFRLFQRLHTREEYAGTGIGLTICQRIVERHGGRIWVASEPGSGTTFYFTLPVFARPDRMSP